MVHLQKHIQIDLNHQNKGINFVTVLFIKISKGLCYVVFSYVKCFLNTKLKSKIK